MNAAPSVLLTLPCLQVGGTELQTLSLAKALIEDGWQVSVLVYYDEIDSTMRTDFERSGATVVAMGLSRAISLSSLLFQLIRVFRDAQADVIHVQYMAPGFTPILAARLAGKHRILATVHQSAHACGRKARRLLRTASSMCDVFISNSLATEESWFGNARLYNAGTKQPVHGHCTLYNSVDIEVITGTVARVAPRDLLGKLGFARSPIVGVVGRLREEKGQATVIRAMPALLQNQRTAGLLVVGDGPDRESLQRLCRELSLEQAVHFAGMVPQEQVRAFYGTMDVLAVPSLHEGFCLVAAEAMAARVPVVASDIPALSEVLACGQAGILTPPGDHEALAAGLQRVLSDHDLSARIKQQASTRVADLFSKQVFDRNVASLHRSVL